MIPIPTSHVAPELLNRNVSELSLASALGMQWRNWAASCHEPGTIVAKALYAHALISARDKLLNKQTHNRYLAEIPSVNQLTIGRGGRQAALLSICDQEFAPGQPNWVLCFVASRSVAEPLAKKARRRLQGSGVRVHLSFPSFDNARAVFRTPLGVCFTTPEAWEAHTLLRTSNPHPLAANGALAVIDQTAGGLQGERLVQAQSLVNREGFLRTTALTSPLFKPVELLEVVSYPELSEDGGTIVLCASREQCELAARSRPEAALVYHGSLTPARRRQVLQDFGRKPSATLFSTSALVSAEGLTGVVSLLALSDGHSDPEVCRDAIGVGLAHRSLFVVGEPSPEDQLRTDLFQTLAVRDLLSENLPKRGPVAMPRLFGQQLLAYLTTRRGAWESEIIGWQDRDPFNAIPSEDIAEILSHLEAQSFIRTHGGRIEITAEGRAKASEKGFHLSFEELREYRLFANGEEIGHCAFDRWLLPGESLLFGGESWRVTHADEDIGLLILEPGEADRSAPFSGTGPTVSEAVRHRMRRLYEEPGRPTFISEKVWKQVRSGRSAYSKGLGLVANGQGVQWLLLESDQTIRALTSMVRIHGVVSWANGPFVHFDADERRVREVMVELVHQPPDLEDVVLAAGLLRRKFAELVPIGLLVKESIRADIDAERARVCLAVVTE